MDNRLISYLHFFNIKQDYYECHEYGEHLWLELGRPIILKGLIQAAVCLYHLSNGNLRGAATMWARAKTYLQDGLPFYEDIDIQCLINDIEEIFTIVLGQIQVHLVTPEMIQSLGLPTVRIRILNPQIAAILPEWIPKPLDESDG